MRRTGSYSLPHPRRSAFSLIEVMMAVIILGLGLVMVATMFPVAWDRARTLAEFTTEQSVWPMADQTVRSLVECATTDFDSEVPPAPVFPRQIGFRSMGFAGDLLIDAAWDEPPVDEGPLAFAVVVAPDTRVHALNLQNILISPRGFIDEDPWMLELEPDLDVPTLVGDGFQPALTFGADNYTSARVLFHQRVYPPMKRVPNNFYTGSDLTPAQEERWQTELDTKRFAWGVLHRLRTDFTGMELQSVATATRVFDMYYVTLRRSNPTNRYARQNADPALVPNPAAANAVVTPEALDSTNDVMFPVPWRVQIEFSALLADGGTVVPRATPNNVPTEAVVPPSDDAGWAGGPDASAMMVNMFPAGTMFVDEVTGQVYEVTNLQLAELDGTSAVLTLDREVFQDDLTSPLLYPLDPDNYQPIRTVWVYPPPAPNREAGDLFPAFEGNSPVVDIQLRTVPISPRRN